MQRPGHTCILITQPPFFAGATAHFAYALDSPWNFVSNPVRIGITLTLGVER